MPRSCQYAIRLDSTQLEQDDTFLTVHEQIRSRLDLLDRVDVCNLDGAISNCNALTDDSETLTLNCLAALCNAACSGNSTSEPSPKDLNYHVQRRTMQDNLTADFDTWHRGASRNLVQSSTSGAFQSAEEQFFQLPSSDLLCCNGVFCKETEMCQSMGTQCADWPNDSKPFCQVPDPLLLIPVHFILIMGNSDGSGTVDAKHIGRALGKQLGILNRAFRGRMEGCNGDCVDTRIQFTAQSCIDAQRPCMNTDWQSCSDSTSGVQIVQVAGTSSQVQSLVLGPESYSISSTAWLESDEGQAAVAHIKSALSANKAVLNVLVIQADTSPVRIRATWPWARPEGHVLPFHGVAMTSSALPGVLHVGSFIEGKSLVHAAGHWLGLLHTYHAANGVDPCDANNTGDFVQDTPQQAIANTLECEVQSVRMPCPEATDDMLLDSCPCSPGLDQVTNFMDEGPDSCLRTFSRCQAHRMHGTYWRYRAEGHNASYIRDMVVQARLARSAAVANGYVLDDLFTLRDLGWEHGWCATPVTLGTDRAMSLGASVGLGALAWAATVAAALALYTVVRRKHQLHKQLNHLQATHEPYLAEL